jgi:hypothetical protein
MQRFLASAIVFAAALVLPIAAHADPIDDFVLTGGGQTQTFSLPATSYFIDHYRFDTFVVDDIEFYYVPIGLPITLYFSPDLILVGPQTYSFTTVPASNPPGDYPDDVVITFIPGTYAFQSSYLEQDPPNSPISYTLTITPETATATTPEPSSLVLLSTGIFGLLGLATLKHRCIAFFH